MQKQGVYSGAHADFTVDGANYSINLLTVQEVFKLQFALGNQIKALVNGASGIDPDAIWTIATKLLGMAEVNGYPLDIEHHFAGKVDQLDIVLIEALRANAPDFFKKSSGLIVNALQKFASESGLSKPQASKRATAKK